MTNHSAHSSPLIRIHTYNGNVNFSMKLQSFETALTHGGKGFSTFFFSYIEQGVAESDGARIVVVGSREGAYPRFFVSIHKTRGSEWSNRAYERVSRESLRRVYDK